MAGGGYLKAREIADRFHIPCDWEINGNVAHYEALPEFEVNRLQEPPPAPEKPAGTALPTPKPALD